MDSKKYNNIKLAIGIGKGVLGFALMLLFAASGLSLSLENYLRGYSDNKYLLLYLYILTIGFVSSIISFPISYYSGFHLEHKFKLSNQTFLRWIWENLKGVLISLPLVIIILALFYWILNEFGSLWWLPFGISMFLISVVLAKIAPVIILPLFYKLKPLENDDLKSRILKLAGESGMKLENVFRFDMSKNTKKANAAFTGLGKTKKVLLGDTLLDNFSNDEIETVLAHEFGHYEKKHIIKNIVIGTASSFLTFFLMAYLYQLSLSCFGFSSITQISALPLLVLWAAIINLFETPITSAISRKFEYEADEYAVQKTNKPDAFISTLDKLTEQNLADKTPHPFVEWFFYSHPSIKRRTAFIESLKSKYLITT
jgi:STE24 endopeptidase